MRAFMWGRMREWLTRGCISDSSTLEQDLVSPGYRHNRRDQLLLEEKEKMKARGVASPDEGDALALTFAIDVETEHIRKQRQEPRQLFEGRDIAPATDGLGWMD